MIARGRFIGVVAMTASLVLAGCASTSTTGSTSATTGATSISSTDPGGGSFTASSPQTPSAEVDGTVVDISIGGRAVTPTNAQAEATVGKPIVLKVSSDAKDQLHVHSVPERTFEVEARPDQAFEFTVDVPGQVDVELHDLNRTVVTIQVRP